MNLSGMVLLIVAVLFLAGECLAATCSVATTPVSFGTYNVFSASATTSSGTIIVKCNNQPNHQMQVVASISTGSSGTFSQRQMKKTSGSEQLNYNLYSDASRSIIWGDGSGGSSTVIARVSRQNSLTAYVYGTIPARQNLSAGSYSDTLIVTVVW